MTDKPTQKEMDDLFVEETGFDTDDFPAAIFDFARAVLAKWGQPAQAAEPVARLVIGKTKGGVSLSHMVVPAAFQLQEGMYALCTAPQPVEREPVAWKHDCAALLTNDVELWIDACPHCGKPRNAPQPVEREPLPKFLALKFHARRDKKATVTLLFPGHEAADAWVRGIKGGQHGTE